jgi:two-component system response regulator VicR
MSEGQILLLEDDPDLSEALVELAESMGYDVLHAANGRDGLALLDENRPALMLVDLFMPVMGGIEFLHAVKRNPALGKIPCVIMTGANDRMVGVKEDVVVLYKPFDLDVFADILRQHCTPQRA